MGKGFKDLFDDLQAGRNVRESQEEMYRLVSAALLEPLRGKIPRKARPRLDAEDVLHEALLRAFNNVPRAQCETERQFLAWVYRIARNLMVDQAKRMSAQAVPFARDSASGVGAPVPSQSEIPGGERGPESTLERHERIEQVLGQMRGPEADVIRRRWIAGQSFAEIAAVLRKTPKAAKELYTRAWKKCQGLARRGKRGSA